MDRRNSQFRVASAWSLGGVVHLLALLSLALASPHWVAAQATSGSISGFVTDNTGAAVSNAQVSVKNEGTGVESQTVTDNSGFYNVTNIIAGQYAVAVVREGFKTFSKQHIVLGVDSTVRTDARLVVGSAQETVTVTAEAAALKTEKTDVDATLDQHDLETLPVSDNNLTHLYLTTPGVVPHSFQIGNNENPSEGFMTSVNGQLWMANDYQVDGITDIAWGFTGLQIIVPPPDAVHELKITTANYDPEYGSVGGMVAQYVTKSGSNELHGSAYWFNRNSFSFARNPFTETGTRKPNPFNENIEGVAVGGPIRKEKMFFFTDYRRNDRRLTGAAIADVPNDAFRNGDFSAYAATNPIYDPATGNADGSGRTQFPNNVIPSSRFNPVAVKLLALLPHPNLNQNVNQNFLGHGKALFNTSEIDERVDWNISEHDKVFERFSDMRSHLESPGIFGNVAGGFGIEGNAATTDTKNQLLSINHTHTFGTPLLSEARIGYAQFHLDEYQNDSNLSTDNTVGITGINTGPRIYGGLSNIVINNPFVNYQFGIQGSVPRLDRSLMFQGVNNWTKIVGNHQIRWGVDARRNLEDLFTMYSSTRGDFSFGSGLTSGLENPNAGLGMATFLLGEPTYFDHGGIIQFPDERATRISGYAGDTWRATRNITLNFGGRWDYISPISPKKPGGDANFNLNTGEILISGVGDVSKYGNVGPRYTNFAPRLGATYAITEKTVIRAGLGRSYFINGFDAAFNHLDTFYPVAQNQTLQQNSPYFAISALPSLSAPVPAFSTDPLPKSGHMALIPSQSVKAFPFERKTSSVDSANFSIERQVTKDFTVTVAYVGNRGKHLDYSIYNANDVVPGPGDNWDLRRPYFHFGNYWNQVYINCTCDSSSFDSLQLIAAKRFTSGYSINSNFTWGKALDDQIGNRGNAPTLFYDIHAAHGVSYLNRAAIWNTTHSFKVPFGKGERFGANANPVVQTVLGGWTFDGFTTIQSGIALSPNDAYNGELHAWLGQRPNRVPGVSFYSKTQNRNGWLNKAAFSHPTELYQFGDAHPGIMRGPGLYNADWSLGKSFAFRSITKGESPTTLDIRWESFNAFNHTNLGSPAMNIEDPNYGKIYGISNDMRRMQFEAHVRW
jgi:hypothetical protein